MAIVMLRDLPGGVVPGTTSPKSDLCTYPHLENAAKNVLQGCLSPVLGKGRGAAGGLGFVNPTGYDIGGTYNSIGVFLWDTDSVINHEIQVAEVSTSGLPSLTFAQPVNVSFPQSAGHGGSGLADSS